jgi:two-component system nitrate/nitrite response regulator NarL
VKSGRFLDTTTGVPGGKERERITLVVADDHPLYRRSLIDGIRRRPELELLDEAATGTRALELIREREPDVALVDVQMPALSGIELLGTVNREKLLTKVMLITGFEDSGFAYEAMALGAGAYMSKTTDADGICDAVATVARGGTVVDSSFQEGLINEIKVRESGDRPDLTDREVEVLRLTADGNSVADVARLLYLSEATVKTHLHHSYSKLEVSDRAAAVAKAIRMGLIS